MAASDYNEIEVRLFPVTGKKYVREFGLVLPRYAAAPERVTMKIGGAKHVFVKGEEVRRMDNRKVVEYTASPPNPHRPPPRPLSKGRGE